MQSTHIVSRWKDYCFANHWCGLPGLFCTIDKGEGVVKGIAFLNAAMSNA